MMRISASRILKFDAGHRVVNHESKCATLHGHEYKAHIYAQSDALDKLGRVIDFGVLKEKIGAWIDENWDHTMILWSEDPALEHVLKCPGYKQPYIMDRNPTAENLAEFLLTVICPKLLAGSGVEVTKIVLYETTNCFVEVSLEH